MLDDHNHQCLEKELLRVNSWSSFTSLGRLWRSGYAVHQLHEHDKERILMYHCSCLLLLGVSNYNDMEVAALRQPLRAVFYL